MEILRQHYCLQHPHYQANDILRQYNQIYYPIYTYFPLLNVYRIPQPRQVLLLLDIGQMYLQLIITSCFIKTSLFYPLHFLPGLKRHSPLMPPHHPLLSQHYHHNHHLRNSLFLNFIIEEILLMSQYVLGRFRPHQFNHRQDRCIYGIYCSYLSILNDEI